MSEREVSVFIHPIDHNFKKGDPVIDLTAKRNRWPDDEGVVKEVDGSMVLVEYPSGVEHWKMHINIRKKK